MRIPLPGDVLEDRYELGEMLGQGGFSVVFRAVDRRVRRDVVVKIITPEAEGYSTAVRKRFEREAAVLAALRHPNTITLFDFGESESGLLFMVFEFVEGRDLREVLRESGRLDERTVVHIVVQVLEALEEAHRAGVIHRDLKPANVICFQQLDDPYRAKLIDFGIAKTNEGWSAEKITKTGLFVGTARYMAPEQICGEPLGPPADIYSLGLVAIELLSGERVVAGSHVDAQLILQLNDTEWRIPHDVPVSPAVRAVFERMAKKDVAQRYATASDVLRDLRSGSAPRKEATVRESLAAPSPSPAEEPLSVTTVIPAVAALLAALGLVGGALLLFGSSDPRSDAPDAMRAAPSRAPAAVSTPPSETETARLPAAPEPARVEVFEVDEVPRGESDEDQNGGCGRAAPFVGLRTARLADAARTTWSAYVPQSYDPNTRHRVLLVLHNTLTDGRKSIESYRLDELADRKGWVIVAPHARHNVFEAWENDEIFAVRDVMREVHDQLCLDLTRVVAFGHGGGGKFAFRVGCDLPVAAIAVTGFRPRADRDVCENANRVAVISLQGREDPHLPTKGGMNCAGATLAPLSSWTERMKEWTGAGKKPQPYASGENGECRQWDGEAKLVTCLVESGHQWAEDGTEHLPTCRPIPNRYDYLATIERFLEEEAAPVDETWF